MLTVKLYGHLAEQFGATHKISANTPAEVIRAFCANYKDFKKSVVQDGKALYKIIVGRENRSDTEQIHLGASKVVKIVPVVAGAGGLGKVVLGAALIVASFYMPTYFTTQGLFAATNLSSIASSIGWSLVLGGVSQMLFSPPKMKMNSGERPENLPSYAFSGAVNTTGQGNPVPICYGRLRVGSQVISSGLSVAQL